MVTMAPTLYIFITSAPSRGIRMLIKHLELNVDIKLLDMFKREQFTPEFLKLNPTHTVPTFVDDDGFILWDSHAILPYLAQKYGKDNSLYPKDLKQRAIVDQMLSFDNGTALNRLIKIAEPMLLKQKHELTEEDYNNINEVYGFIENFLANNEWIAGNNLTIADFSLLGTISSSNLIIPIDAQKYPKLINWLKKCESLPAYEANKAGLEVLAMKWKQILETN